MDVRRAIRVPEAELLAGGAVPGVQPDRAVVKDPIDGRVVIHPHIDIEDHPDPVILVLGEAQRHAQPILHPRGEIHVERHRLLACASGPQPGHIVVRQIQDRRQLDHRVQSGVGVRIARLHRGLLRLVGEHRLAIAAAAVGGDHHRGGRQGASAARQGEVQVEGSADRAPGKRARTRPRRAPPLPGSAAWTNPSPRVPAA